MYHGYCKMCILANQNSIGRPGSYIDIPPTKKGCKNSQLYFLFPRSCLDTRIFKKKNNNNNNLVGFRTKKIFFKKIFTFLWSSSYYLLFFIHTTWKNPYTFFKPAKFSSPFLFPLRKSYFHTYSKLFFTLLSPPPVKKTPIIFLVKKKKKRKKKIFFSI